MFLNTHRMKTFLFTWNPKHFHWESLEQDIQDVNFRNKSIQRWTCGNTKSINPGDRIFLVKLGTQPKGIIGAGYATIAPFWDSHWRDENKDALYIDIDFEVLLNPVEEPILTLETLKKTDLSKQNWTPQSSGISIKPEFVDDLEKIWFDFLTTQNIRHNPFVMTEADIIKTFTEGNPKQITLTKYERNIYARNECLKYYGFSCKVCEFNFEKTYGGIGKNFIHVHHLNPISLIGNETSINPISDLRPICPNCHSMIHRRKIPYSIEEMKEILKQNN